MKSSENSRIKIFMIGSVVFLAVIAVSFAFFKVSVNKASEPVSTAIFLRSGLDRESISEEIGENLNWTSENKEHFAHALRNIQWDAFNQDLLSLFTQKFRWNESDHEIFLTHSSDFMGFETDILEYAYASGEYEVSEDHSPAEVAEMFVNRVKRENQNLISFLDGKISAEMEAEINDYVKEKTELLPDLISLPPQDVGIRFNEDGRILLVFSTTYYNTGLGNLELVADPETSEESGDTVRTIFQRIYHKNGSFRDVPVGNFEWHEEHLHYHFENFIEYKLAAAEGSPQDEDFLLIEKATYCVRDITRIDLEHIDPVPADYLICGKEKQGVSVGWGDTYFQTYGSQNFDITNLSSGIYRLSFYVNPENLFEEITNENNESHALIEINKETGLVEILELFPSEDIEFEHIHKTQNL